MGQARKASAVRPKRRVSSGDGRGAVAGGASRIDQASSVPAGERMGPHAVRESVDDRQLAKSDQAVTSYSGLRLKAEAALEVLITATGVPANVRAAAVRTALELVGAIGSRAKAQSDQEDRADDLDPERLSVEDIDREIAKLGRV
jgi:hypothetical protein